MTGAPNPLFPSWAAPFSHAIDLPCRHVRRDGLTDWVRLRSGAVCYGLNRGYGRFGAKVTMDCKL